MMDKMNMLAGSYGYVGWCCSASKSGKTSLVSRVLFTVAVEQKQLIK